MLAKNFKWYFLVFTAYLITGKIGLSLNAVSGFATLVWLPTGIGFAAVYILGYRIWPSIFMAAFILNMWIGAQIPAALGISLGNSIEAVAGVYLFSLVAGRSSTLDKVSDAMALVFWGAILSTALSASFGVLSLHFVGVIKPGNYISTWMAWWIGDAISNLVVTPLILIWRGPTGFPKEPVRLIECLLYSIVVLGLSYLIFSSALNIIYWRPYLIIVLLAWVSLRFGQKITQVLMIIVAGIAVWCTMQGMGPYNLRDTTESLVTLQIFIACLALTVLFFGALREEREVALQFRKDFITIASHELKTPVTILNLQLEVLSQNFGQMSLGSEASTVERTLNSLKFQLYRLNQLVDSLLDVALLEKGQLVLKREETDLTKVIEGVTERFRELLDKENCKLELSLQADVIGSWNSQRIEQILMNLLINSLKYGSGKPISIDLKTENGFASMYVKDNGVGIARENQGKIFERFERINSPQNTKGLGLGLYINKQLVESFGGTLTVSSELGAGATFEVRLPIN